MYFKQKLQEMIRMVTCFFNNKPCSHFYFMQYYICFYAHCLYLVITEHSWLHTRSLNILLVITEVNFTEWYLN